MKTNTINRFINHMGAKMMIKEEYGMFYLYCFDSKHDVWECIGQNSDNIHAWDRMLSDNGYQLM